MFCNSFDISSNLKKINKLVTLLNFGMICKKKKKNNGGEQKGILGCKDFDELRYNIYNLKLIKRNKIFDWVISL